LTHFLPGGRALAERGPRGLRVATLGLTFAPGRPHAPRRGSVEARRGALARARQLEDGSAAVWEAKHRAAVEGPCGITAIAIVAEMPR
jgi:hypothetical protein